MNAAVLFADISGFTPMSDALAELGTEGAEELQRVLNNTFAAMIDHIHSYGGAVAHFGGDAITAFFSDDDEQAAHRGLQCGLAMQASMGEQFNPVTTAGGLFHLRMRVGVGYGQIVWLVVGDPEQWTEFVLLGEGLERAVEAEHHAKVDQVLACPTVSEKTHPISASIETSTHFRMVTALPNKPNPLSSAGLAWDTINPAEAGGLIQRVASYLPEAVYRDLVQGHGAIVSAHRPVTNVFVQFEGLDSRSQEVGVAMHTYCNWVRELVQRYGGNFNRLLTGDKGNQLHILFGAPTAHSDDPARALRFALALQEKAPPFVTAQRVGIASGNVFAGPVGSHKRREYTVMGDVVNLAARLMGICPDGAVLVDEQTMNASGESFSFSPPKLEHLKGKTIPIPVYRPLAEIARRSNLESRYVHSRRPIIGREAEQEAVLGMAEAALRGAAGLVILEGPVGTGKSRLLQWLVERWLEQEGGGYGIDCQPHTSDAPFVPWIAIWRAVFNLEASQGPTKQARQVKHRIHELTPDRAEAAGLMGQLLGLPMELSQRIASLEAETRRELLFALSLQVLVAQSTEQPLLLILEDLQLADDASLDLLTFLAERIVGHSILLCVTCRTKEDIPQALQNVPISTTVSMFDLPSRFGRPLVESILGPVELPDSVRAVLGLVSQSAEKDGTLDDGLPINPLFLDAAVHTLLEAGVFQLRAGRHRVDPARLEKVRIPDTLHGLILARLDRLPALARDVLQVASILGREFRCDELEAAYGSSEQTHLEQVLTDLVAADHLSRQEVDSFVFRNAAVHNVVYESTPFVRRRELHGRIARWLEETFQERPEAVLSALASHYVRSREHDRAVHYALAAGHQAQEVFAANKEAASFYDHAELHLTKIQASPETAIDLYASRGQVRISLGDYDGVEQDANRALDLARKSENSWAEAHALNLLAELRYWQERSQDTLKVARAAHRVAQAGDHRQEIASSLRWLGFAHSGTGSLDESLACFQQGRELAAILGDQFNLALCVNGMAIAYTRQGSFQQALEAFIEALALQRVTGRTNRIVAQLNNVALAQSKLGRAREALTTVAEGEQLARESGNDMRLAYLLITAGEAHCYLGSYSAGGASLQEAVELFDQMQDKVGRAYACLGLGRYHAIDIGELGLARRFLEETLSLMRELENEEAVTEALLSLSQLENQLGNLAQAQEILQEAADLVKEFDQRWMRPELAVRRYELAAAQGAWEVAHRHANNALDGMDTGGNPDWRATACRCLALVAAQLGNTDPAPLFQRSVSKARQRARKLELARCLAAAGKYLSRLEKHKKEGNSYLAEAAQLYERMKLANETGPSIPV